MTKRRNYAAEFASIGGKARAKKLTPERRREIAAMGGAAKAKNLLARKNNQAQDSARE